MSIFSYVCWPHICLFLKSICSYPSPPFEWVCLFFSCKSVLVLCRFWISAHCQMGRLQKILPPSVGCQITLMIVYFAVQKLRSLIRSSLSILAFVAIAFGVLVMKSLSMPMPWIVLPRFSSRVFMVLGIMFKSFIHLELILV